MRLVIALFLLLPFTLQAHYHHGVVKAASGSLIFDCLVIEANIGDPCDDGNVCTGGDAIDPACNCTGTPLPDSNGDGICDAAGTSSNALILELRTNATYDQAGWELLTATGSTVVCSGGGYNPIINGPIIEFCYVPDACYLLRVFDSVGDGFGFRGGYQLRLLGTDPSDTRIIDNLGNFNTGSLSSISGGPTSFCFPMSTRKPVVTCRDKVDWISGEYFVAEESSAVSAQWQVNDEERDDGYEFWFFDPNGGYSFRRFRYHLLTDGLGNIGPTRTCHMKINNWAVASHIPANKLMNVRIRTRVEGVNSAWGPAYRFKIDPALAACPITKLNNINGDPLECCNKTRLWGTGNFVHAVWVQGANKYQFRFRLPAESYIQVITSNVNFVQLNWTGIPPLTSGKTYQVDVRISKNNGATWCQVPGQWGGDPCTITIVEPILMQGGVQQLGAATTGIDDLLLWPNPNKGDRLSLLLSSIAANGETVNVDIYDLTGKRVVARVLPTQGEQLNAVLDLPGLRAGVYLVNITAGGKSWTRRLVITD